MKKAAQNDGPIESSQAKVIQGQLEALLGAGWESWEPETLWSSLNTSGVTLSAAAKDKIQAVKTILSTNVYWRDYVAFEKVTMGLNGLQASFDSYQHPSPAMVARGLLEASSIRSSEFSDEVLRYIAVICFEAGLIVLPGPLAVAQESLDAMTSRVVGGSIKGEVSRAWDALKTSGLSDGVYGETVTGIQLARMGAIMEYAVQND
jgi:hypothetical protein